MKYPQPKYSEKVFVCPRQTQCSVCDCLFYMGDRWEYIKQFANVYV